MIELIKAIIILRGVSAISLLILFALGKISLCDEERKTYIRPIRDSKDKYSLSIFIIYSINK